jgi:hypothetical protein
MSSKQVFTLSSLVIAFLTLVSILLAFNPVARGVIALPGYEHAVYLCGESLVVNAGHESDPQIRELIQLAHTECAKY